MKNIHVLPTDKTSRLYLFEERLILGDLVTVVFKNSGAVNQNIYITSDEEIKVGDWMIRDNENPIKVTEDFFWDFGVRYYKIILTTDQDLIKDGVQAIDDEFLKWFVKNPSCEFVEVKFFNNQCNGECGICDDTCGNWYKIIIIPKEETLEEAAIIRYGSDPYLWAKQKERDGFIEGGKWQQERSFSKEEVLKHLNHLLLMPSSELDKFSDDEGMVTMKWFKQF